MDKLEKSIEISDAKIQFVSLVDKAANLRQFLVTKGENGGAQFSSYGKILKVDAQTHYITGLVYEPLVEDAHGNYMTEEEIRKAAYWYAKNGDKVDLQHSFESADGLAVVENYVAPCDMAVGDTAIVKGSWLITVECSNADVWSAVQKGELTGFSMGGLGKYSEEDTDLDSMTKGAAPAPAPATDKVGIFKRLGELLGLTPVEKGEVLDRYNESARSSAFWNAVYALQDVLYRYDYRGDRYVFATDTESVREALEDFSRILTDVLTLDDKAVVKAITMPVLNAGKKMSSSNKKTLDDICEALSKFKSEFDGDEEGEDENAIKKEENNDMDRTETAALVSELLTKALSEAGIVAKEATPAAAPAAGTPAAQEAAPGVDFEASVEKAVKKALVEAGIIDEEPASEEPVTKADIEEAVAKALEPLLKSRGLSTNLNSTAAVEKSGPHYLSGIL